MKTTTQCKNYRFWQEHSDHKTGVCFRYPPTVETNYSMGRQPWTHPEHKCGEFKPNPKRTK